MKSVIRVHKSGILYIVVSIILGVLSINSGNNFHYLVTAILLGFMLASGIAGRHNVSSVQVIFDIPDEIYAGVPFLLSVEATNKSRRVPVFLIKVRVGEEMVLFPCIAPGGMARSALMMTFKERGYSPVLEAELSSVYPFNLFTRYWPLSGDLETVVFPHPVDSRGEELAQSGTLAEGSQSVPGSQDIVGVRPYVEGDSMRLVHWKSSARTGKLSTRVYDDPRTDGRVIDLPSLLPMGVERALSLASGAIRDAIAAGEGIGISFGEESLPVSSLKRDKLVMLTRLALYD